MSSLVKEEEHSARSNRNVTNQSDIITIDDDDDDDDCCLIFENINSQTPVTENNKEISTVEPEITVFYLAINNITFDNLELFYQQDSFEALYMNELSLFPSEGMSLEGVISVDKCDGNEYICIEKPNFEITNMQQYVTNKNVAPFKINNLISYFRRSVKDPNDVQILPDKIKVSANYKVFVACLVFLHSNYHYFFHTIYDDTKKLAGIVHLHLNARMLYTQMETSYCKVREGEIKNRAMEDAQTFLRNDINTYSLQFSCLFVKMMQKFKESKPLSPFYQTLFGLILFQRIIYHLHCIEPENIMKHFIAIRFVIKDLLSHAESQMNLISLLTDKSHENFVNDFNNVTKSIKIFQLAMTDHYCGRISNRNRRGCDISIYQNEMSALLSHINGRNNGRAFSQSQSVASPWLHINDTIQNPMMPDSNTLGNSNTGVPQGNHNVCRRVQVVVNNTNDNYNVCSNGSGTNYQQDGSLEQRVQRIDPNPQYGIGQSEQRPTQLLPPLCCLQYPYYFPRMV